MIMYWGGWPPPILRTNYTTPAPTSTHIRETWKQQSEEQIEDDEIPHQDGGHEVRDAGLATDEDAVPHGLDPLPAQHAEDDHETVHEVNEIPPGHRLLGEALHIVWNY